MRAEMAQVSEYVEADLKRICGEGRVSTWGVERKLYSADIGAMPRAIKPFVPSGIAGAVVRPADEGQIVELMKLARERGLKLTPRGASTSGYGGVLPAEGAVVVDISGMDKVLSVDLAARTATVQAAAIWEPLQRRVNRDGLDLRLYPSSLPSSTVGGWLAQGGSGFGSYEFGLIKENVVSARVVLPTGEVRVFSGEDLERYVADAEGITGIITEVTLGLRPLEAEVHRLVSFPDTASLGRALSAISVQRLPIWSLTFLNPESVALKKRLPHRHGHPYEEAHRHYEPTLPESYLLVVAYPESRRGAIDAAFTAIAAESGGTELDEQAAEHEWEQRFAPMRLKRIGPSVIPTEVVVPLTELAGVLDEIADKIKQPFVLEGMVAKGDKVVLLGFIPHDERSLAFNAAFALSLSVINIAKRHGGAAYSTGLYFRSEAASVLGAEKVAALTSFKQQVDPRGLMNPNKVVGSSNVLDVMMGAASTFEGLIRPIANAATAPAGDPIGTTVKNGVPPEVAFYSYACAQCGYCVPTCEEYSGRGWLSHSPRGKYLFLREVLEGREKIEQDMVDRFLVCTTCEVCNSRCQLQLPVEHSWMAMRGQMINEDKKMTFPPFEMMAASLRGERDIWAGKKEHRADWVPEEIKPKLKDEGPLLYFAGCTASFVNTDVAEASVRLLTDAGYDLAYMGEDEACCGIPMKVAGKWDLFEEIYLHNTAEARKRGAKTIVTSCPACGLVWKEIYAGLARERGDEYDFEVKHYSELVADALADGRLEPTVPVDAKVAFHDSCHMGRAQGIYDPPRDMLKAMPGVEVVEMEHNREDGLCCGSVLTLVGEKPVAPILGGNRLQEAIDVGADKIVAACPCCQVQLRDSALKNEMGIHVTDLARFFAESMGYTIEDKTDYSMYMWSYFDKFIDLMRPEEMATVMAEIFPQMMDAMPPGMKPMMRAMKYVPGGLDMMSVMMPAMFPMLVPGIMPKVMPDMIEAVDRRVGPLPADMEALMPDLLPQTMDSLMPNYLPQLIPHVTPLMIEYIRTEM
jgi:Fe-S oxidoreductase/FAD/FMN-containing dehydrogenase